ncbi:MAG TPA: GntR family transcriptional regulator, partial [Actinomycetes bacterium]|nr:GntR family transcriptional regulator [Actinomycetes bacterium]
YLGLREAILKRRFLPGQRLVPADLAREFGVSRMPVYEALKRLALEDLVEIHPRRGTVVSRVTAKDVAELSDARLMVEVHAAAAAVARATPDAVAELRALVAHLDEVLRRGGDQPSFDAWSAANARLHRFLVAAAGNDHLLRIYDGLHVGARELRVLGGWGLSPLREFQVQHRQILEAFEARNVTLLQHVLRLHIQQATERVLATLQLVGGVL